MSKKLTSSCNDALQTNQNPLENIEEGKKTKKLILHQHLISGRETTGTAL